MKIKATVEISIEVDDTRKERILNGDKSAFLMTIYNGNNDSRPELGQWYLEGDYTISGDNKQVRGGV